jgi:hypothetical protein
VPLIAAGVAVTSWNQPNVGQVLPIVVPFALLLLGLSTFASLRMQFRRERARWDSYVLTIGANAVRLATANVPPVAILRPEVTRIVVFDGKGLQVTTADRHKYLFIPEQLVAFEEVRKHLTSWSEPESPKVVRNRVVAIGWAVLLCGSWIACGVIPDVRRAMIPGAVLLVVGTLTIRETLKAKLADRRQKAATIGLLAFIMFAPFGRLLLALMYSAMSRP